MKITMPETLVSSIPTGRAKTVVIPRLFKEDTLGLQAEFKNTLQRTDVTGQSLTKETRTEIVWRIPTLQEMLDNDFQLMTREEIKEAHRNVEDSLGPMMGTTRSDDHIICAEKGKA